MAEEDEKEDNNEEPSKKDRKKLFLFIGLVVALILISVGGSLLAVKLLTPEQEEMVVFDENGNPVEKVEEVAPDKPLEMVEETPKKGPAIYYPLKPPIIVNYEARGRQRFLQAEITLMSRDDDVIEAIEIHMPMIRNSLILLFSGQVYEELQTDEGRELFRQAALAELQGIMEKELGKPGIEKLLFTNLVMQ